MEKSSPSAGRPLPNLKAYSKAFTRPVLLFQTGSHSSIAGFLWHMAVIHRGMVFSIHVDRGIEDSLNACELVQYRFSRRLSGDLIKSIGV